MEASARITCQFLGLHAGDSALLCMPLDYIAGKMMVVRSLVWGLRLITVPPNGEPLKTVTEHIDFAAMVPLQVWNSLRDDCQRERLRAVRHLIIGGGAIDTALEQALADFPHQVWSTYGMTETLSHIALRRLNGPEASQYYTPFEGVSVSLADDGCLVIDAPAVHDGPLVTNDIAELSYVPSPSTPYLPPKRQFRILGRKDNVICSGGIKIQTEEVEAALRDHLRVPYIISKAPDERLGEQMVLLLEDGDLAEAEAVCRRLLPKYWQPRRIVTIDHVPLTATGKPARKQAELLARETAPSGSPKGEGTETSTSTGTKMFNV